MADLKLKTEKILEGTGITIYEAAARELKEETGLEADLSLIRVNHKMDYADDGTFLEDKYFFVFRGDNVRGKFTEVYEGGKNTWVPAQKVSRLQNLFPNVLESIEAIKNSKLDYLERSYPADKY